MTDLLQAGELGIQVALLDGEVVLGVQAALLDGVMDLVGVVDLDFGIVPDSLLLLVLQQLLQLVLLLHLEL